MLRVEVIPCLADNYAYLIIDDKKQCVLVDAPEADPIRARIDSLDLSLQAVLLTHHHDDHSAGLEHADLGYATVYGAAEDSHRLPSLSVKVKPEQNFNVCKMRFEVMSAYGHTIGHLAYYLPEADALFTGDSLMFWGCGRLFEGKPQDMWDTLQAFAKLPPETKVYSGHNYGETNGRFAISLGGYLDRMDARMKTVEAKNAAGEPVVPVTMKEELETNPFLLASDDEYAKALGIADKSPVERFAHIRKLRDTFS